MFDNVNIVSPPFVTALWIMAVVVGVVAVLAVRHARRQDLLRVISISIAAALCLAMASADSVNAHYAYLPTAGDIRGTLSGDREWMDVSRLRHLSGDQQDRASDVGVVVRLELPEDRADGFDETQLLAYLPPQYFSSPAAHFPVIYLFHGSPGRPADWFHGGQAARIARRAASAGRPAIVVAPQLSRRWTDDPECVDGVKEKVESHLLRAVIPRVDANFRTIVNRSGRIFAGMSAGGYCALNLGLRHRGVAATIVDMSGLAEPAHTGGAENIFGAGPRTTALVAANAPAAYAATMPLGPPTRVWLDTGTADKKIMNEMAHLAPVLTSRGIDVQWRVRSGGHTFWVWTAALREWLPWALGGAPGRSSRNPSRPGPAPHDS